jgi:L(+)-tartrate dehydratase beta subunit
MERFTRPLMSSTACASSSARAGCARLAGGLRELGGVYLAIVGGTAALETTWIEQIEDVDLDDLNPESLWKFRIKGFGPLLVAMDSHGGSLYTRSTRRAQARRAAALAAGRAALAPSCFRREAVP